MTVVYQIIVWDQFTPSAENVVKTLLDKDMAEEYLNSIAEQCHNDYDFMALVSYGVTEKKGE